MLLERSRAARAASRRLGTRYIEIREHVGLESRRSLTQATDAADSRATSHPLMLDRLDRLSGRVGRSPEIERAKTLLAGRYGISRGDAFAILRSVSSHSNRKLRDVASELVNGARDGDHGTLNPSG